MMTRPELEQWLSDPGDHVVPLGEIAGLLHMMLDASRRGLALADAGELRDLRFALTVLRDAFSSDEDVRRWLRTPLLRIHGMAPADLVSLGRIDEFVDLAMLQWNGEAASTPAASPRATLAPA